MSRVAPRCLVLVMATLLATGWLTAQANPVLAAGTVALTTPGGAYAQNFNTLATSNTDNTTLPLGWDLAESGSGSRNNGAYGATHGTDANGDVYSLGPIANAERAYGTLLSIFLTPTIGASFTNSTGAKIIALDLAYTGEQWRLGALGSAGTPPRGADRLDFQYSLDATSLTTGTWADVDALDFVSPTTGPTVGALSGNAAANRAAIVATIGGLSIANGAGFWLRWTDFNVAGSDDSLGVDDFSLTPQVDDSINLTVDDAAQDEGGSGTSAMSFMVSLSNPAGPGGVTFDIATVDDSATTGDGDYVAKVMTGQAIPEGQSTYAFSVLVNGETSVEPDETFFVNVTNTSGVDAVVDGHGVGTIFNDDFNEAPTIAVAAGSSCSTPTNGGSFALAVEDDQTAAGDLTVSLTGNSDTLLVPNGAVVFGGFGANRTVAITAASGQTGTAMLTIGVSDGFYTVTTTITVRVGAGGSDVFVGGAGADLLIGGQGSDNLSGLGGADVLCGGKGTDILDGGDAADALDGGQGGDNLSGGNGNDILIGGQGDDILTGGAGADGFWGDQGADTNIDLTPPDGDTSDGT